MHLKNNQMNKQIYWNWIWGTNQDKTDIHSDKLKFTDFDAMKEHSAKHSDEHKWIGDGYWSDYEKVYEEHEWIKLDGLEFNTLRELLYESVPFHSEPVIPMTTEFHLINGQIFKFKYINVSDDKCEYHEEIYRLKTE